MKLVATLQTNDLASPMKGDRTVDLPDNTLAVVDEVSFLESVTGIVEAVAEDEVDRGVIPVENSIEGSVTESLDALAEYYVAVVHEVVSPIRPPMRSPSMCFWPAAEPARSSNSPCRPRLPDGRRPSTGCR